MWIENALVVNLLMDRLCWTWATLLFSEYDGNNVCLRLLPAMAASLPGPLRARSRTGSSVVGLLVEQTFRQDQKTAQQVRLYVVGTIGFLELIHPRYS